MKEWELKKVLQLFSSCYNYQIMKIMCLLVWMKSSWFSLGKTASFPNVSLCIRRLMGSTNQADPGFFYFRISWILMECCCFLFFSSPLLYAEPKNLQKSSIKMFDQKFRCLMVSTDQADPIRFYFRISWILMERRWFHFFCPLHLVQGLRSLQHWLLQKLSMKRFWPKI